MKRSLRITLLTALAGGLLLPAAASATGGKFTVSGGTPAEQAQIGAALAASTFDWNMLPQPVQVTIQPGVGDYSTPGQVYLDPMLLDMGRFAWGTILHEFGHQVDFQLLNDAQRARLAQSLGGTQWWPAATGAHSSFTCERFASTLSWAYWTSSDNSLRPQSSADEAGAVAPAAFRALLADVLDDPALAGAPAAASPAVKVYAPTFNRITGVNVPVTRSSGS